MPCIAKSAVPPLNNECEVSFQNPRIVYQYLDYPTPYFLPGYGGWICRDRLGSICPTATFNGQPSLGKSESFVALTHCSLPFQLLSLTFGRVDDVSRLQLTVQGIGGPKDAEVASYNVDMVPAPAKTTTTVVLPDSFRQDMTWIGLASASLPPLLAIKYATANSANCISEGMRLQASTADSQRRLKASVHIPSFA